MYVQCSGHHLPMCVHVCVGTVQTLPLNTLHLGFSEDRPMIVHAAMQSTVRPEVDAVLLAEATLSLRRSKSFTSC
jgi:hypothetical protein